MLPPPKRSNKRLLHLPLFVLPLLLMCAFILAACEEDKPQPVQPTATPSSATPAVSPSAPPLPTPTEGEKRQGGTLTIRLAADVSTLNPWLAGRDANAQSVAGMIFSGLTRLDNHLQPQPDLAEKWEVSPDGTQVTFHLRRDVRWHDGQPFTAQDVEWSYRTLASLPADTASLVNIQDTVVGVQAVGPVSYTVRFTFKRRYSPLLANLSIPILPQHLLAPAVLPSDVLSGTVAQALARAQFNSTPIGTGPFAFSERQPGVSIILRANENYFGGRPLIDRVGWLVAPNESLAQIESAVREGQLLLAQLPPNNAEALVAAGGGVRGGAYTELGYDFVAFNLREPRPFSDTRLRQAWALALDKPGLTFEATGGGAEPVWSDVNRVSWAYNPNVPKPGGNPDEARRLLAEAGWTDTDGDGIVEKGGKPLRVALYVRSDNDVRRKAAEAMVAPLRRVGIDMNVELADFNTSVLARLDPNTNPPFDFDAIMLGFTRSGYDPDPFALFHSSQIPTQAAPNLHNFTGFAAPEFDELTLAGRSTYDFARRKEIYARTQAIIADQLPYYFLWAEKFGVVAAPKLKGEIDFTSPRYLWNVAQWWIDE